MSLARAMPHRTALDRRRAVGCPNCGAEPHEPCRRWVAERYPGADGEGHWKYRKTLHPERRAS